MLRCFQPLISICTGSVGTCCRQNFRSLPSSLELRCFQSHARACRGSKAVSCSSVQGAKNVCVESQFREWLGNSRLLDRPWRFSQWILGSPWFEKLFSWLGTKFFYEARQQTELLYWIRSKTRFIIFVQTETKHSCSKESIVFRKGRKFSVYFSLWENGPKKGRRSK